jgi:hypothetical protein
MGTKTIEAPATGPAGRISTSELLKQYGCGQVQFSGSDNGLYERHLLFDNIVDIKDSGGREQFERTQKTERSRGLCLRILIDEFPERAEQLAKALTKEGYGQAGESLRINIFPFFFEECVLDLMKKAALPHQAADANKNVGFRAGLPQISEDYNGK